MRCGTRWLERRIRSGIVGLLLLLAGCGGGGGSGGADIGPIALGTDVIVADVDGDGRADVLAITHLYGSQPVTGRLTVWRQTAQGAFAAPESVTVGCYPWRMTLADVDGDGRPDLVVTDGGAWNCDDPQAGNALYLLRQDPTRPGHFLAPQRLMSGVTPRQAAVADLNGDGVPDIAFGEPITGSQRLIVLYQDRQHRGQFAAPSSIAAPGAISHIVAGDIDGDGRSDLFFLAYGESSGYVPNTWLAVMTQRADGTLSPATLLSSQSGLNVQRLAITDVDGNGRADLIAHFTPFSSDYRSQLRVLLQGAAPLTWGATVDTSLAGVQGIDGTAFGDLNQDGRLDVVLAGSWPEGSGPLSGPDIRSRVNPMVNDGHGAFALASAIDTSVRATAVAVGDVDGDGRNDIVLYDGTTAWWLRQSATVPGSFGAPVPLR
jgi:hypothetical protein